MFPATDNPAQRLLQILKAAQQMDNRQTTAIWGSVFSIQPIDNAICYRIVGHLLSLVDAVDMRIRQIPGINHELYLRDLPAIRRIICPDNLHTNWHNIKGPLDTGVLTGLEFCAAELSKTHSEEPVLGSTLAALRAEFAEILGEVGQSSIPAELKLVLFDLLTSALLAIDHYKILGNDGLKRSIAYTIGMLTLHKEQFKSATESGILKKTHAAIKHLFDVVTTAHRIKEIGDSLTKLLV